MAQAATATLSIARVRTVAFVGIEVRDVDVQVQIGSGLPAFTVVGLPDKAIAESRERVRAALGALGMALPPKRIVVNLAPADLQKEGSHFDLPIALGLLAGMGVLPTSFLERHLAVGELSLDGQIRPVAGTLLAAVAAAERRLALVCPQASAGEAAWLASDVEVIAAPNLLALVEFAQGMRRLDPPEPAIADDSAIIPDLRDVKGQESAKRALEIAAAGGHNLLMIGPPGAGKSMLAARLVGLLPPLDPAEVLEVSMIHSVAGVLDHGRLTRRRPFRSPHHGASVAAMVGGGPHARPGEISLAHKGVLFLDELPEFHRGVLEALRQPLEAGRISVARAQLHVTYPARVQLVAAMNPCRCGYMGNAVLSCGRAPRCGQDYQSRLSGPLLDRIDLHLEVPGVTPQDLALPIPAEGTAEVAARVAAAREAQAERLAAAGRPDLRTNAEVEGELLDRVAACEPAAAELLRRAAEQMHLTARGYHRALRVARTIADLDGSAVLKRPHIAEAIALRRTAPARH